MFLCFQHTWYSHSRFWLEIFQIRRAREADRASKSHAHVSSTLASDREERARALDLMTASYSQAVQHRQALQHAVVMMNSNSNQPRDRDGPLAPLQNTAPLDWIHSGPGRFSNGANATIYANSKAVCGLSVQYILVEYALSTWTRVFLNSRFSRLFWICLQMVQIHRLPFNWPQRVFPIVLR